MKESIGLSLSDMSIDLRERYKIAKWVQGVVVTAINDGLRRIGTSLLLGDVVIKVAQERVASSDDFWIKIDKLKRAGDESVLLLVIRGGRYFRLVPVSITSRP